MDIRTRFKVGDKVFTLINNTLNQVEIKSIKIDVTYYGVRIAYKVRATTKDDGNVDYKEDVLQQDCFDTIGEAVERITINTIWFESKLDNESKI